MNAPLTARDLSACSGSLQVFALFHLNLAFSSIEEEQRAEVIAKAYWPLLHLAEQNGPLGLEASGFTLEEIAAHDPAWIAKARHLIAQGKIEFIGAGYAQLIGPLVPARVSAENLAHGHAIYERLLGIRPSIALVNEQAYAAGLVGIYLDAGYQALLMDWDNPGAQHPEWPAQTRYLPQRALGADGRSIGLIWTNTVAFQKIQRFAHGDMELADYLDYLRAIPKDEIGALCIYASDAEIFDFRPGRYKTEDRLGGGSEWQRLSTGFAALEQSGATLIAPSDVLALRGQRDADQLLRLESAACPVPVKKQRKYNLSRWAVTGRDDSAINAACMRIYQGLLAAAPQPEDWRELCYLWSSDFRTHITQKRWETYCIRLRAMEQRWAVRVEPRPIAKGNALEARFIDIETPMMRARLDRRRGLAIQHLQFKGHNKPVLGGLPHGYFDDIALQADWYTGDCVFEAPGEHKITDLEWCVTRQWQDDNGDLIICGEIETAKGRIEKMMRFHADRPEVSFDILFDWADWGRGSLRLGHFTLLPDAFDWQRLELITHNGGPVAETFALAGTQVDHGAPVSFLVSASQGLGMTEGWAGLGDGQHNLRICVDQTTAPLLGLLQHREQGGSLFCQLVLSALELDETRKPSPYQSGPRRFRFSVKASFP